MGRRKALTGQEEGGEGEAASPDRDPQWVSRIRSNLTAWYRLDGRAFPWRTDRDPYRILVSETMLVQTTVAAVVPFFERFLRRFPNVEALANADESEVLKAWEGLGYYRRARQLQAAAKAIVEVHAGTVPDDLDSLRKLPGVGPYIAGAIASFAFDRPAAIVEANTQRVLARWLAIGGDLKTTANQARLWEAAQRLVPETGAGEFNQAFMELGGTLCSPKSPRCMICPVAADCLARRLGIQDRLPVASPKPATLEVIEATALVVSAGRVLVVKRPESEGGRGLWSGFWEFPTVHIAGANPAGRLSSVDPTQKVDLAETVRRLTGVNVQIGPLAQTISFGVTRHKVRLDAFHAKATTERLSEGSERGTPAWVALERISELTFGSSSRRLFKNLEGN